MLVIRDQHCRVGVVRPLRLDLRHINPTVVITMEWHTNYHTRHEFLTWFLTEQEYIDAEFRMIVMFNFGVWLYDEQLSHVQV